MTRVNFKILKDSPLPLGLQTAETLSMFLSTINDLKEIFSHKKEHDIGFKVRAQNLKE